MEAMIKMISFSPVLVRHVGKNSRLTAISLLDMPNINWGSIAHQMYDDCRKVREEFSLG